MIVDYTPEALANLDEIWDWNAERYGNVHADTYLEFLRNRTDRLSADHASGRNPGRKNAAATRITIAQPIAAPASTASAHPSHPPRREANAAATAVASGRMSMSTE